MKRLFGLTIAASLLSCGAAWAQVSDGVVKLGVLNDMSSLYADASGKGGVLAAQMAVEDFGGKVLFRLTQSSPLLMSIRANWATRANDERSALSFSSRLSGHNSEEEARTIAVSLLLFVPPVTGRGVRIGHPLARQLIF